MDGFSSDDLLAIGTRRAKIPGLADMSATDINAPIPFVVGQMMQAGMEGHNEEMLKNVGEHKIALPAPLTPSQINQLPSNGNFADIEKTLDKLQSFLGIRTK